MGKDSRNEILAKISKDFLTAVLSYKKENYSLKFDEKFGGYKQAMIPQLLKKKANKVYQIDSEFFFICFTDYNDSFKVISLSDPNFDMRIEKMCEPGKLTALDVGQEDVVNGFGKKMVIIDIRDEEFFYEIIRPQDRLKYLESHPNKKQMKILASQF